MTDQTAAKVYIVDDDDSVRESLRALLGQVGVAAADFPSAESFLKGVRDDCRGCLLLDVRMPGMGGLRLQEVLRERGVSLPVIVLTGHADVPMAVRALKAGARDFVEKPFNPQDLLERIEVCLAEEAQAWAVAERQREAMSIIAELTAREREVLGLLVTGKPSKVIASKLGISEKTVDVHRSNIMRKAGVHSVAELVHLWLLAHPPRAE
jgi:FixJ family two-component response regulator